MKKIVAIGGGENGRIKSDGTCKPYETYEIDEEIVNLTGKSKPNFLFIGHSQIIEEYELSYFETMKNIYNKIFNCNCRVLTRKDLINNKNVDELLEWADIIYEGGGDTLSMIELWKSTEFDIKLQKAWEKGKVMCGVSAGANAWFKACSSDSLKIQTNDMNAPMITVECLNFVNLFFTPHCDEKNEYIDRLGHMKESLKDTKLIGIGLSNCSAIEIIDDKYRILTSKNDRLEPFAIRCYWDNDIYNNDFIDIKSTYSDLNDLINTKVKKL